MTTVAQFAAQWLAYRATKVRDVQHEEIRLRLHVLPRMGAMDMAAVNSADLEDVVVELDYAVIRGTMAWTTAERVWAVVTKMFDDAARAKDRTLRCLFKNPAEGVRGPDRGRAKEKNFLFPSEALRLLSCIAVPSDRRKVYAIAMYTGMRAGELAALTDARIDLDHGTITVCESKNVVGDRTATKNGQARTIPIETSLWPLLAKVGAWPLQTAMHSRAAEMLRTDLGIAGVTRDKLFEGSKIVRHVTFHDLRATYATWCAIRGDAPLKIQRRMGHASMNTTQLYVREAENLIAGFGEVFPPLPRM